MPVVQLPTPHKMPPPLRIGIDLVNAGVARARRLDVSDVATLPLRGLDAVRHPRRTVERAIGEVTELGGTLVSRLRGGPARTADPAPSPERVAELVEQVTDPFGLSDEVALAVGNATPGAVLTHDQLPLADFDHLTLGSLRARLPKLDAVALVQLRDYERAHANRLPVVTMIENRIAKLANTP